MLTDILAQRTYEDIDFQSYEGGSMRWLWKSIAENVTSGVPYKTEFNVDSIVESLSLSSPDDTPVPQFQKGVRNFRSSRSTGESRNVLLHDGVPYEHHEYNLWNKKYDVLRGRHYDEYVFDATDNTLHQYTIYSLLSTLTEQGISPNFPSILQSRVASSDAEHYSEAEVIVHQYRESRDTIKLSDFLTSALEVKSTSRVLCEELCSTDEEFAYFKDYSTKNRLGPLCGNRQLLVFYALLDNIIRQLTLSLVALQEVFSGMLLDIDLDDIHVHVIRSDAPVRYKNKTLFESETLDYNLSFGTVQVPNLGLLLHFSQFPHANVTITRSTFSNLSGISSNAVVFRQDLSTVLVGNKGKYSALSPSPMTRIWNIDFFDSCVDLTLFINLLNTMVVNDVHVHPAIVKFYDGEAKMSAISSLSKFEKDEKYAYSNWVNWFFQADRYRYGLISNVRSAFEWVSGSLLNYAIPPEVHTLSPVEYWKYLNEKVGSEEFVDQESVIRYQESVGDNVRHLVSEFAKEKRGTVKGRSLEINLVDQKDPEAVLRKLVETVGDPTEIVLEDMSSDTKLTDEINKLNRNSGAFIGGGRQGQAFSATGEFKSVVANEIVNANQVFAARGNTKAPNTQHFVIKRCLPVPSSSISCPVNKEHNRFCEDTVNEFMASIILSNLYTSGISPNVINVNGGFQVPLKEKDPEQDEWASELGSQISASVRTASDISESFSLSSVDSQLVAAIYEGMQQNRRAKSVASIVMDYLSLPLDLTKSAAKFVWKVSGETVAKVTSAVAKTPVSTEAMVIPCVALEYVDTDMEHVNKLIAQVQSYLYSHGVPLLDVPSRRKILNNIVLQLLCVLYVYQRMFRGMHNDLHRGNVFIKLCDGTPFRGTTLKDLRYFEYVVNGELYKIPNLRYFLKV